MRRMGVAAFALWAATVASATPVRAHGGGFLGAGEAGRVYQELIAVFGKSASFAATATVTSKRADGTHTERFPYLAHQGRFRFERDVADNPFLQAQHVEHHRRQGTDVSVTLVTPDGMDTVFPRLKAYFRVPKRTDIPPAKIERRELGEETIDGHPCRKLEYVVTAESGSTSILVWEAEDQQGMPIRVVNEHDGDTSTLDLADFRAAPPASSFEVPAGYVGYDNVRKLLSERQVEPQP